MATVSLADLKKKWGKTTAILVGDAVYLSLEEWEQWIEELEQEGISEDTLRLLNLFGEKYGQASFRAKSKLKRIVEGVWRAAQQEADSTPAE